MEIAPAWIIKTGLDRATGVPDGSQWLPWILEPPQGLHAFVWFGLLYLSAIMTGAALQPGMTVLIEFQDVRFRYGDEEVIRGVSLALQAGEVLAVLGPSGAGKSSIVRLALGLSAPTAGTIRIMGQLASQDRSVLMVPEERGLGVVFQDLALWPHLTVEGNLAFGVNAQQIPRAERRERALERGQRSQELTHRH